MTEAVSTTGVLEHLDPNTVEVETNVRTEASITKQFVASIKEQGVLVPVVAVRGEDGRVRVRAGQRRTIAAREAGLQSIPVYITAADLDTATRLSQQIVENDQRMSLKATDRVKGIQQLLDTGLSVTKIAKRLSVSPDRVKKSKAVGESESAMSALAAGTVTFDEAAVLAEFADDDHAVNALMRAVGRPYFEHEAERLRRARIAAAEREAAAKPWREKGFAVTDRWGDTSDMVPLHALLTADGNEADESVVVNPANWAITLSDEAVFTDLEGNPVDESLIDWATDGEPETQAAEGMLHCDAVVEKTEWVPDNYYCLNPEAEGLTVSNWHSTGVTRTPDLGSEDLERKAAEKAERRRVIVLNKAGDAAQSVRRKFVTELLQRKTPPKGTAVFIAERLIADPYLIQRGGDVAGELLGADVRSGELLDHATDARAEVVLLGVTLGSLEFLTGRDAWRRPGDELAAYLRFLAANGYGLSAVEQVIVGEKSVAECYEELA